MENDFSIEEMIQRLAEFPPKSLKDKIIAETEKTNYYYSHSMLKENIYNYVVSLPEPEIRALFDKAAKRSTNITKPCCNVCTQAFPSMYEDIPGSHVRGWWLGQCGLHEDHPDISSSQRIPSPEWCPLKKKEDQRSIYEKL